MVTSIEREIYDDAEVKTIVITSKDDTKLDLSKKYKLAKQMKESKITKAFKNSILGTEIGVKSEGFSTTIILATLLAIASICAMYIFFRV